MTTAAVRNINPFYSYHQGMEPMTSGPEITSENTEKQIWLYVYGIFFGFKLHISVHRCLIPKPLFLIVVRNPILGIPSTASGLFSVATVFANLPRAEMINLQYFDNLLLIIF